MKPTTIYILWPGTDIEDCILETNQLGTFHYPKKNLKGSTFTRDCIFYKSAGYIIFEELIKKGRVDILNETKIFSSNGKKWDIEKFLSHLDSVIIK